MGFFSKLFKNRAQPGPVRQGTWDFPLPLVPGVVVTPDTALELSAVWACVSAISRAIATSPWQIYKLEGRRRMELPDDHLTWTLNVRPNPETTALAWRQAIVINAATWGNGYAEIVRDQANRVAALYLLDPALVSMHRESEPPWSIYYLYRSPWGGQVRLEPAQVFHLRGTSIDGLMGDCLITHATRTISTAMAAEQYASAYYANGGAVGIALTVPEKQVLSDKTIDRLRKEWAEWRGGPSKAHKPLFLEHGMDAKSIAVEPEKAQLVDTRKFSIEEICRFWNVPPHKIQHLERMTYNNVEWIGIDWARDGLAPWAKALEQEADYKLFSDRGPYRRTRIDLSAQSQGDFKTRMEGHSIAVQNGVETRNEARHIEGWNDLGPEGDVLTVQSNMTTLGLVIAGQTLRQAAPQAQPTQRKITANGPINGALAKSADDFEIVEDG